MERGGSLVGLDFDATVAWPSYDWMGVAKAALESVTRYLARDLGPQGHPRQPGLRRPAPHRRRLRDRRLLRPRGLLGRAAPLGWDADDPTPVADAAALPALRPRPGDDRRDPPRRRRRRTPSAPRRRPSAGLTPPPQARESPGGWRGRGSPGRSVSFASRSRSTVSGGKAMAMSLGCVGEVEVAARVPGRHRVGASPPSRRFDGASASGVGDSPTPKRRKDAGQRVQGAVAWAARGPSRRRQWRISTETSCEPEPGPTAASSASIAVSGSSQQYPRGAASGARLGRVHVEVGDAGRRDRGEGVHDRLPSPRSGASSSVALGLGGAARPPRRSRSDWPRSGSGIFGIGGKFITRPTEVTSSSGPCGPLAPGVDDLGRTLDREEERPGVDLGELAAGRTRSAVTTPKLPPPPAHRPEQLGSLSASTRRCSPSAVTSSIAVTRLQASPCLRPYQPTPPPRL